MVGVVVKGTNVGGTGVFFAASSGAGEGWKIARGGDGTAIFSHGHETDNGTWTGDVISSASAQFIEVTYTLGSGFTAGTGAINAPTITRNGSANTLTTVSLPSGTLDGGFNAVAIGANWGGGEALSGDIAEVIVFDNIPTNSERQTLREYIGNRYKISDLGF